MHKKVVILQPFTVIPGLTWNPEIMQTNQLPGSQLSSLQAGMTTSTVNGYVYPFVIFANGLNRISG